VTNHRNGLSAVGLSIVNQAIGMAPSKSPQATPQRSDLAQRFSFQPYSETSDADTLSASAARHARIDKRLLEEIYELISQQRHLDTRDLLLRVHHGSVIVEGCVADRAMRAQIGNFIRRRPFVQGVINLLRTRDIDADETRNMGRAHVIAA
jgi:hypothetical protein